MEPQMSVDMGGLWKVEGLVDIGWARGRVAAGIRPASIHDLYIAMGQGKTGGFTVPAINVRAMGYETARAVIRAAKKLNAGAFIFEIARSEIGYTEQRPHEYAAILFAAALREGFTGPLFIQGDHVQTNAKKYNSPERDKELETLRGLINQFIPVREHDPAPARVRVPGQARGRDRGLARPRGRHKQRMAARPIRSEHLPLITPWLPAPARESRSDSGTVC